MRLFIVILLSLLATAAFANTTVVTTHVGSITGRVTTYTRVYDNHGNKIKTTITQGNRTLVFNFKNKTKSETVNGITRRWPYNPATMP